MHSRGMLSAPSTFSRHAGAGPAVHTRVTAHELALDLSFLKLLQLAQKSVEPITRTRQGVGCMCRV